jgi:hypothetical protein
MLQDIIVTLQMTRQRQAIGVADFQDMHHNSD